ncbi:uncharacterized protein LOC126770053 [Nymphalis io]|uniref:uncharacterized protein LOC126770053 n=1 Tax=Inachis io TaxID=171585 RepID=UPI002166D41D|nr:uncharacterized protein LOC126770053 [Nymphalis io]
MIEYDVDFLISLIEERPVLWDTSNEDYKNKFIKQDAWKDVCKSLFTNFEEKENNEKTKLGNTVIQRWRGIKDTFYKYEKKLKDASRSGSGSKNIKEYHLYKQLQFLKKNLQNETTTSINESENEQDNQEGTSKTRYQRQPPKRKMVNNKFEDDIVKILKEPENRHISFFKGILPSLERLDDNKTLIFQSRVLQILTELHQPHGHHSQDIPPTSSSSQALPPESSASTSTASTARISSLKNKRSLENDDDERESQFLNAKKKKELDNLFLSYADTFKKFPAREQAIVKLELAKLFANTELQLLNNGVTFTSE